MGNQERIDVDTCHVWFHTTAAYTLQTDLTLTNPMCAPCKQLFKRMREAAQFAILISPEERSKRVQPESPITQLSPASQNLRKQLQCSEKHSLTKTLSSVQRVTADCLFLYMPARVDKRSYLLLMVVTLLFTVGYVYFHLYRHCLEQ